MNNGKTRKLFTGVFECYEYSDNLLKQKSCFKDIRTQDGSIIIKSYVFDEDTTSQIRGLTLGEYVSFMGDVEFKNVEFCSPHASSRA